VDGIPGTFSHPEPQASAAYYFQVDLGADTAIVKIRLNGRLDGCCPDRLVDPRIEILDGASITVFQKAVSGQVTTQVTVNTGNVTGRYVRIVNANGADYGPQVGELIVLPPDSTGSEFLFHITSSTINPATGTGSLTFTSEAGANYGIFAGASMSAWAQVGASFPSGGTTTTKAFTDPGLTGAVRRYYQVRKMP
jgi:hypothetical protein